MIIINVSSIANDIANNELPKHIFNVRTLIRCTALQTSVLLYKLGTISHSAHDVHGREC